MPITDVSLVTETMLTLLRQVLVRDTALGMIEISAAPPDDDNSQLPTSISIHMFHMQEDREGNNFVRHESSSGSPVQQTPMGLILNYIVTVRSLVQDAEAANRSLIEQRLLGYVARAFHDYPVINDETLIPSILPSPPNQPLLQTSNMRGNNNEIHIALRPVGIEEAVNFWSAEQESISRLSLFYEVRLIQLQTPSPSASGPPVLSIAEFITVSGRINLIRTRCVLGFELPSGHPLRDPTSRFRFIDTTPARVSLFANGLIPETIPVQNNRIVFEGSGFQGDRVWLSMEGPVGDGSAAPVTQRFRFDISGSDNTDMAIQADSAKISLGFSGAIVSEDGRTFTLYPGIYRARVVVGTQISDTPQPRFLETSSSDSAYSLSPQIDTVVTRSGGTVAARRFRINLFGSYLRDELDIQLYMASESLIRDANVNVAGNYDFAAGTGVIDFTVDTSVRVSPLPVRLIINGAEAAPAWAEFS